MSDISAEEAVEAATDVAENIVEEAPFPMGVLIGGLLAGASAGFAAGYFYCRKKLDAKYMAITNVLVEAETSEMRKHYQNKVTALEGVATKPSIEALVRDKGYVSDDSQPPMAVDPPSAVVDAAEEKAALDAPSARPPVPVQEAPALVPTERIFEKDEPQDQRGWDYSAERARRSPLRPYVIHIDEKRDNQAYDEETYTYYEADDVICNEVDEVLGPPDRDRLIGEDNLNKFGHGSGDPSIVYIRNDQAEVVIELVLSKQAYAEEVHGFRHSDPTYPRTRKLHFDDE